MYTLLTADALAPILLKNSAGLEFRFLENGAPFSLRHGEILINQVLGHPLEGGIGNIYLRTHERDALAFFPLIGPASASAFSHAAGGVRWQGENRGVEYVCTLRLAPDRTMWFWTVQVKNTSQRPQDLDLILAQDLGIACEGAVRSNELYTSQYIDHTVLRDRQRGYLICSRQNQPMGKVFPWIMHGCLDGAAGYLTDGFQFYGPEYKDRNAPTALLEAKLPNSNYQYEFALPTLQTRRFRLRPGRTVARTFFAVYVGDHPKATSAADAKWAKAAAATFARLAPPAGKFRPQAAPASLFDAPAVFASLDPTAADLKEWFGAERRHAERRDGKLCSFFYGRERHVILKAKELRMERPSGHILRSGRDVLPNDEVLSSTAWMYGVFHSHITLGNTNFNKFLTLNRNPLNVLKASGQRIFVNLGKGYELLGLPSAFEVGTNHARWIYKGRQATVVVKAWTALNEPACFLEIEAGRGGPLEFLITHHVLAGNNEYGTAARVEIDPQRKRVTLRPAPEEAIAEKYPEAVFHIVSPDAGAIAALGGDGLLYADGRDRNRPYVVIKTRPVPRFSLAFTGSALSADRADQRAGRYSERLYPYDELQRAAAEFWTQLSRGAVLGGAAKKRAGDLTRLNDVLAWYLHNAMVHYTIPHGLEQYSGAAWGLRDVCQGPVEFLLSTRNFGPLREVLKLVYAHQFLGTGDWPQWFMFDRYQEVQSPDSHADIIHWPIKALCDYIEATGDLSLLDEPVVYTDDESKRFTADTAPIFEHTLKQIEKIERDCVPGTALVRYGHGDWEDTLQPADPKMRDRLVSTWTVELAYQTLERYRRVCERAGKRETAGRLAAFCGRIRGDFNRYLVKDGVVAGLAHFRPKGVDYLLHPRDRKTGISYRLIPMTRGMIAGLFTPEQAAAHVEIIRRHLFFPDGVRLMNRPMTYRGGVETYFKRAETAANFGREIGLQYVHAHIRFIEAMAKVGRPEEAFRGLLQIIPIALERDVPAALPRQSNCYFSSSDAAFADRYQAGKQFGRVRTGRVGVKGGWRVYSSGPGIYIHQLISNVLGLREHFDDVLLDPVLPRSVDGLTFDLDYAGKAVRYVYRVQGNGFSPREVRVNGRVLTSERYSENPYRRGGMLIPKRDFITALDQEKNVVEIHI